MFKNYITISLRTLWKNKLFTAINILGLAIGISASLVIYLLVNYHFTFDQFEKDGDRIYRVVSDFSFSGEVYYNSGVRAPLSNAMKNEITGLEANVPFRTWDGDIKVSVPVAGKEPVVFKKQQDAIFADKRYFGLINYQWLAGSADASLLQPYQTVLTETTAGLYFPGLSAADVIGKEIVFNDTVRATITGVVKDITYHTDFTFKIFVSRATLENTTLKPNDWEAWDNTNGASQLLVKLSPGSSVAKLESDINKLVDKYNKKEPGDNSKSAIKLQPLSDLHFNGNYGGYSNPIASKPTLYSLLVVAAILLLLGCINFINLTTAHAAQRAKEIGIRKTMGSSRKQLVVQFLTETFLLTFAATVLSVLIAPLILQLFSGFLPEGLHVSEIAQPAILLFLAALVVVVTLVSGFYPAMILSGYKPVLVLKNQAYANTGKTRNAWLRKSLTISQFVIAQAFIMGVMLVSKQITYSLNKDMGFKKDAIVYLQTNYYDTSRSNKYALIDKLRTMPEIAMVSLSTSPPSSNNTWSSTMKYKDGKKEIETDVQQKYADSNYIHLYQIKLLAGRNISTSDTVTSFMINETYAHILGFQQPEQAIGKYLEWSDKLYAITGVVADFNQHSLHEPVKPMALGSWQSTERTINIALQPQNDAGTTWKNGIAKMEQAWKQVYPNDDFEYQFYDESIAKYYEAEQQTSSLLMWATGLAVFISCLGLLGLVIYTTTQRTKEIGVRKVLGASIAQIVAMISKDFVLLVLVAFVVAAPLAWIGMNKWLENFAYRTEISWWIFLSGGLVMVVIALITLSFQTVRAAMMNPVKSLRTE
ncbi:MAG TPA: ABC transporter permease [Panacibacter sp.]|nr:ABC transporter permease [Panacibacter sp.]HNP45956.1 ABC transporter permease [Panacibacter sp.]